MKSTTYFLLRIFISCCGLLPFGLGAQNPAPCIEWQNTIGGSDFDYLNSLQQTLDGGYILGGYSISNISGDKTENSLGGKDYWVVKLDAAGNIEWQNTIGGSDWDELCSLQQTSDGGYILGGYSKSNISGDKMENSLGLDYWVVKLDAAGNIQWQNTIRGNASDWFSSLQQTSDGGYILGGISLSSISGDKTENSLGLDIWVVKLDAAGNIQWQNTIGGGEWDYLRSLQQTSDGGYILGGNSPSNISGDKTENSLGGEDYWVLKLDAAGNIQWQNTIGSSGKDYLYTIKQILDGGYILGGHSASNISGDKTENGIGGADYWVLKLDAAGNIQWQNTIGGIGYDELYSLQQTLDGGYILGGWSKSNISGDKTENSLGGDDYWVVKLTHTTVIFNFSKTLCPGETEIVGGQIFSQTKPTGQVVLQAANGCDSTINVNLTFKNAPVFNLSKTLCPGQTETVGGQVFSETKTSGQVVLQVANGCDSTINVNLTFKNAPVFNLSKTLCPGQIETVGGQVFSEIKKTGQVILLAANGCDSTVNVNLTFKNAPVFNLAKTLCPGQTETVGGQVFSETKTSGQVILTAANGCDSTVNVSLTFKNAPVFNLSKTLCPGQIETVGGQIFSETKKTGQVVLQAANGCDSTVNVSLNFSQKINLAAFQNKPATGSSPDGAATVNFSGGTAPFKFEWSGAATGQLPGQSGSTANLQNLPVGNYFLTCTDAAGCTAITVFTISNCAISVIANPTPASCFGAADGSAVLQVSGAPLATIVWSNGATGPVASKLAAGNYTATLTDASGCTTTATATVSQPAALQISGKTEVCSGDNSTFTVGFSMSGGTPPFVVDGVVVAGSTFSSLPKPSGSTYNFQWSDSRDCPAAPVSGQKTCGSGQNPTVAVFAVNQKICEGETIELGENGTGGTAWTWASAHGWKSTQRNPQRPAATPAMSGTYSVTVTGSGGATAVGSVVVEVFAKTSGNISETICTGEDFVFCQKKYTTAGKFTCILKNAAGCDSTLTLDLQVVPLPELRAKTDEFVLPPGGQKLPLPIFKNDSLPAGDEWVFEILSPFAAGDLDTVGGDRLLPVFVLKNEKFAGGDSLFYKICSSVCRERCDSAQVFLQIQSNDLEQIKRDITDILTPGLQDGSNDLFDPTAAFAKNGLSVFAAELTVFNRWGERVFFSNENPPVWDGLSGNGKPVPEGAFFYILKADVGAAKWWEVKGNLSVLR